MPDPIVCPPAEVEGMVSGRLDCQSCGACCAEAGPVAVYSADDTPIALTRSVRGRMGFASWEADVGARCMKRHLGGRCVALRGEIGTAVRCSTYTRRPAVCREFEPGSEGCLAARERMAWKLSRMEWQPHGYGPWPPTPANIDTPEAQPSGRMASEESRA